MVNGLASAQSGCQQCHGSKVALQSTDGTTITVDGLQTSGGTASFAGKGVGATVTVPVHLPADFEPAGFAERLTRRFDFIAGAQISLGRITNPGRSSC